MASRDSLEVRKLLERGIVQQTNTDTAVALRLRYIGTGTVTSITTVNATSVETITSDGGTDTFLFATYTTMGALADAITAAGVFEVKVLDVLRSAGSDNNLLAEVLTTATSDELGNAVYDIKVDTNAMFYVGVCLSATRAFGSTSAGHRVHLQEIAYVANMGTAAADQLKVTARKGSVERVVLEMLSVDTTLTTVSFASGAGYITSNEGEELIVTIKDGASMADGAYMRVTGLIE